MTAHFVGAYKAFAANGASGAPPWLKEMRERAIARFAEVGFPTTRLEQWRFTNVQPISETPFELQRASWELGSVPAGVTVATLGDAVAGAPDFIRAHLGRYASVETNPFTALSTAFLADGIVIRVAARSIVSDPIQVTWRMPSPSMAPATGRPSLRKAAPATAGSPRRSTLPMLQRMMPCGATMAASRT